MISRAEFLGAASPYRLACGWCRDAGHSHSKLVYGDNEGKELVTAQTSLHVIKTSCYVHHGAIFSIIHDFDGTQNYCFMV